MNQTIFEFIYMVGSASAAGRYFSIFFAKYLIFILIGVFIWLLFVQSLSGKHKFYLVSALTLSFILGLGILVPLINSLIPNERPFLELGVESLIAHEASSSMPSRHMMFTVPLALSAFYLSKRAGQWFVIGVVLIGLGRIGAGVHWPLDILAGLALGTLTFYTSVFLLKKGGIDVKKS
ncbi:MAG: phosphatase PAP2 family protein [Candidatus Colwellbacteria bacterium]|nr:phosphatase PAP2 family protein [Candidatus Colwellbacteria bacterium]